MTMTIMYDDDVNSFNLGCHNSSSQGGHLIADCLPTWPQALLVKLNWDFVSYWKWKEKERKSELENPNSGWVAGPSGPQWSPSVALG